MAANKYRTTGCLAALVEYGVPKSVFDVNHMWLQSGRTGVKHASPGCSKYRYRMSTEVVTEATVLKVTRPCDSCFFYAIPSEIRGDVANGTRLIRQLDSLKRSSAKAPIEAAALVEGCDELMRDLNDARDSELLEPVVEKIRAELKEVRSIFNEMANGAVTALSRYCAVNTDHPTSTGAPCASQDQRRLLGTFEGVAGVIILFNQWSQTWVETGDAATASSKTHSLARFLEWTRKEQLQDITGEHLEGESLLASTTRLWEKARDETITSLCNDWEAMTARNMTEGPCGLVALVPSQSFDHEVGAIISTFKVDATPTALLLLVPAAVFRWASKRSSGFGARHVALVAPELIADATGVATSELDNHRGRVLTAGRNAMAFWEPDVVNSTFRSFDAAFRAGAKV